MLSILLFFLMIFNGYTLFMLRSIRYRLYAGAAELVLLIGAMVLLCELEDGDAGEVIGWKLPIVFIIFSTAATAVLLLRELKCRSVKIDRSSIRESADNLPSGLCFAGTDGQPYMVNHVMNRLSYALTSKTLRNEAMFWKEVTCGTLNEGVSRIDMAGLPAVKLADGKVWTFSRRTIEIDGCEAIELVATDNTEIYMLRCHLDENNRILANMNVRLSQYGAKVDELTRSQERLATKERIHDAFGQNLMATKRFLATDMERSDCQLLVSRWKKIIALLKRETMEEEKQDIGKYIFDAAEFAGVDISLNGEMPQSGVAAELIVSAGAEALTNAVRHAGAVNLYIDIKESENTYTAVFTNDGSCFTGEFAEGGGLSALRRRIEGSGGSMSVETKPEFALTVTVLKEGIY